MQPETPPEIIPLLHPDQWVDNYGDILFAYTLVRVTDKQYAEDIVQSVFLSAWKARMTYTGQASEKNWLFAICKNKIIDHYRKHYSVSVSGIEAEHYFDTTGHWTREAKPRSWGNAYEHPGEQTEFYRILAICSSKLKSIQQKVFSLKYMDELPSEEICEMLQISPANYWVLMHRAKLQLRACLEKNWLHLK